MNRKEEAAAAFRALLAKNKAKIIDHPDLLDATIEAFCAGVRVVDENPRASVELLKKEAADRATNFSVAVLEITTEVDVLLKLAGIATAAAQHGVKWAIENPINKHD